MATSSASLSRRSRRLPPRLRHRLPPLSLSVQYATSAINLPTRSQVRHWVRATCSMAATIAIRFVDEAEARSLNLSYRGKDYATNVLSFPYTEGEFLTGDLVLCAAVVEAEAQQQGKEISAHYAHLVIHGLLHLQGLDHERSATDAKIMEAREILILANLGISDPYQ
ncbi:MAG: rRNA maturation RNase YbeY [Rhodocyclaceae bacterium]|nr:rRNA maturation RNase YbeY [Rhodocyclaceae bacterium]